jgi:hypothetical protein
MKRIGVFGLSGKGLRFVIVASLLVTALAPADLASAGGTGTFPPPVAGGWVIEDATSVSGENLLVGGNVSIGHGSLSLTDCVISGNASKTTFFIELSENGTLTAVNCTFRTGNSTDMVLRLRGQASFRSCLFLAEGGPIWMYRYTGSVSLIDSVLEGTFEVKPGNTPTLQNLTVKNAYFGMMNPYPVAGVTFVNCTLGLFAGTNNTVTNCSFYDCESGVAAGRGTLIRDCAFTECRAGVSSRIESNTMDGPTVLDCRFFDCTDGALLGNGTSVEGCSFTSCVAGVKLIRDGAIGGSDFFDCSKGVELPANSGFGLNSSRFSECQVAVEASQGASGLISGCVFSRPSGGSATDASLVSGGATKVRDSVFKGASGKDIRVVSGNCSAVNTSLRAGASEVVSGFLTVSWYLDCTVYLGGEPAAGIIPVNITDQYGQPVLYAFARNGNTGVLELPQYRMAPGGTSYRSPLHFNVSSWPYEGNATVDLAGNKHLDITLRDVGNPWVLIHYPWDGKLLNTSELLVTGTAGDEAGPVSSVQVRLDGGAWVPAEGGENWAVTLNASEGVHLVEAKVTDKAGNNALIGVTVTVDLTGPAITLVQPVQGAFLNGSPVLVRIRTEIGAVVTIHGVGTENPNGNATLSVNLSEGPNDIEVTAQDLAGNRATAVLRLTLDTTPPALSVESPANGALVANTTVTVTGVIEAGGKLFAQGKAVAVNGTSFSYLWSLVEGENALALYAEDAAGNRNIATLNVRRDTIAPVLTTDIADGLKTKNASIGINGTTEPNATVTVNGFQVAVDASGRFFTTVQLLIGPNNITLEAKDPAGNMRQVKLQVARAKPASAPEKKSGMGTGVAALAALAAAAALVFRERRRPGAG